MNLPEFPAKHVGIQVSSSVFNCELLPPSGRPRDAERGESGRDFGDVGRILDIGGRSLGCFVCRFTTCFIRAVVNASGVDFTRL